MIGGWNTQKEIKEKENTRTNKFSKKMIRKKKEKNISEMRT